MMTSASTCPGYTSSSPSSASATLPNTLDECVADDDMPVTTAASIRLVKRPSPFVADSCKKRRKQSTPIRISTSSIDASDDTVNCVSLGIGLCCEGKLGSGPFLPPSPSEQDLENSPSVVPQPEDLLLTYPHVKLEHSPGPDATSPDTVPVNLSGGQNFPPWLSDIQSKVNDWLPSNTNTSNNTTPSTGGINVSSTISNHNTFYVPVPVTTTTTVSASQQLRNVSQPPIRIFNPEAYCELCNKEFCNKYFLKTHKANKHRIYTDPPASDAVSLPVNVPTFTASSSGIKKPNVPALTASDITVLNKVHLNTATTHLDFMHVFCDLCGKSFANKILLKSHRTNIHGFPSDQEQSTDGLDVDRTLSLTVYKEERDTELGETSVNIIGTGTGDKDNMLFKNDHLKDETVALPTIEQDENSVGAINPQISQIHRDRDNFEFSANRTRRLGIMNPEAFCEICCKEYCNKYFLRTHKMKRHGIIIPDENSKDNQKDFKLELSITNNWYQIQTSPLNLIMGEQNTNSSGSCSERKSSPANENECEICGMRFQTLYLAQLHFATAHSQNKQTCNNDEFTNVLAVNNNEKQAPDSISEDLQKLQTMILQLNDLDVSKVGASTSGSALSTCSMCGKEFENRYYLHAHLMTEHGVLLENNTNVQEKQYEPDNVNDITSEAFQHQNIESQSKNISNSTPITSGISTLTISSNSLISADKKDDSNGFPNLDKNIRTNNTNSNGSSVGTERRSSITLTPANSYCEICNKELCNKYFMKTHMQRMHGIEIENGAQIGGVVCNICNKELCSKYFLRVHKHNTHGIVQDNIGVSSNQSRQSNVEADQQVTNPEMAGAGISTTDSTLKLGDLSDLSNRYFTHFTEVCTICSRRFRSTKWLKAHLLGDHGKAGTEKWNELELQLQQSLGQQQGQQRKNTSAGERASPTLRIPNGGQDNTKSESGMQNVLSSIFGTDEANVKQYHCSFCSFSTPVLAFLFVHERSHSHTRSVPICEPAISGPGVIPNNSSSSRNSTTPSAISPLYCAVCNQSFRQPDQLHHHIVSQHTFLSLSSFFGNVGQSQPHSTTDPRIEPKRELPSLSSEVSPETPNTIVEQQADHKCSKCTQCSRTKKQGGSNTSPILKSTELNTDVTITLRDMSKQRQLPATYALPQHQQNAKYMMQAFLMDEPSSETIATDMQSGTVGTGTTTGLNVNASSLSTETTEEEQQHNSSENCNDNTTPDRRFAPSIVFLPVLEKLTGPLTVSFTLTPA